MGNADIQTIYQSLLHNTDSSLYTKPLPNNLTRQSGSTRPNSISVEDAFFGDSGKGSVTAKFLELFTNTSECYCVRYNGGANAGHETYMHGKIIVTHQLPMGIIKEGVTAIMSRGMVIHPEDLLTEIALIKQEFGGTLPGKLLIDERAPLTLDTHRAFEKALNSVTTGGKGATGRGMAPSYASFYERIAVTVKDLLDDAWHDTFVKHYRLYEMLLAGFGKEFSLAEIEVATMDKGEGTLRTVGREDLFLKRLHHAREELRQYVLPNTYDLLKAKWADQKIPFLLEGAQGAGLDPYHGVYPDITASRPMSRNINDATYNIILPEQISLRTAVMKTTYMSSVGKRVLPRVEDKGHEEWIQQAFDEKGRSTGRLRDIYPVSLPIASYLRTAAGYDFLVATHLDATKEDKPITVTTHYTDASGTEKPYLPYQDYLDTLTPHNVTFPGWDGEQVKHAKTPAELPQQARTYLSFLSKTIAPVIFGTMGPAPEQYISWL